MAWTSLFASDSNSSTFLNARRNQQQQTGEESLEKVEADCTQELGGGILAGPLLMREMTAKFLVGASSEFRNSIACSSELQ